MFAPSSREHSERIAGEMSAWRPARTLAFLPENHRFMERQPLALDAVLSSSKSAYFSPWMHPAPPTKCAPTAENESIVMIRKTV
jgi:hypothetical protein